jgi:RNA polymerase sigma factor (sigma-70 family)
MSPRGAIASTHGCGPTAAGAPAVSPAVLRVLVANHARFLAFLERRVGRRELAEEILQEAFVRGIARGDQLRADESAIAWFYRLLRNALVDQHRRADAERRGLAALADEPRDEDETDPELAATICACVGSLVDTLKPEYAEALRRVDLEGAGVQDFARDVGITATNAGVRLHRARQALRRRVEQSCGTCAEHGCHECECRSEPHATREQAPPPG